MGRDPTRVQTILVLCDSPYLYKLSTWLTYWTVYFAGTVRFSVVTRRENQYKRQTIVSSPVILLFITWKARQRSYVQTSHKHNNNPVLHTWSLSPGTPITNLHPGWWCAQVPMWLPVIWNFFPRRRRQLDGFSVLSPVMQVSHVC